MIKIYFEDEHVAVCEKPYGVSSQGCGAENMVELLKAQLGGEIYPVHRLDTTTTGLMVYAKTQKSAAVLSNDIASRAFTKKYLALCHGELPENGEMVDYLYHAKLRNKSFTVKTKRNGAKEARLEFCTQGRAFLGEKSLNVVEILLHTGRTHQIRVQFASRLCPLYGDGKYGAKDNDKIALHSCYIAFKHPITGTALEFASKPSEGVWSKIDLK